MKRLYVIILVSLLAGCGLNQEQVRSEFRTSLEKNEEPKTLEMLKANPWLIQDDNTIGETNLQRAIFFGNLQVARYLLDNGAPLEVDKSSKAALGVAGGRPPLLLALYKAQPGPNNGYVAFAHLLIEKGADVNAGDANGWTPLHQAIFLGQVDTVRLLVSKGAKASAKDSEDRTPRDLANYQCPGGRDKVRECVSLLK